jgi:iron complex outermembrane receptor protein
VGAVRPGTYQLVERLSFTAGVRFTKERREAQFINGEGLHADWRFVPPFIPPAFRPPEFARCSLISAGGAAQPFPREDPRCREDVSERFDGWSWTAGLEFQISDERLAYLKASRGFMSGGFDGRPSDNPEQLEPFDSEELTTYELGVKSDWFDRRLRTNAAFFYSSYVDQQLTTQGFNPLTNRSFTFRTNVGRSYIQGFEIETVATPIEGLMLAANVGVAYGRYKKFNDTQVQVVGGVAQNVIVDRSGEEFGQPYLKYGLQAEYSFPLADSWLGSVRGDFVWRSRDVTDPAPNLTPALDQSPFGLFNARASLEDEKRNLEYALFCKNCFDREYWVGEVDTRNGLGWAQAYYGEPRTFGVEVTYRFGSDVR